jgi:hypothetical protein
MVRLVVRRPLACLAVQTTAGSNHKKLNVFRRTLALSQIHYLHPTLSILFWFLFSSQLLSPREVLLAGLAPTFIDLSIQHQTSFQHGSTTSRLPHAWW